jgi:hypothetical protein
VTAALRVAQTNSPPIAPPSHAPKPCNTAILYIRPSFARLQSMYFGLSQSQRGVSPKQAQRRHCRCCSTSQHRPCLLWNEQRGPWRLTWRSENPPGKFEWKRNALRHSYISYRVVQIQNVAQVALEAGNSPRMVFAKYRELVGLKDAEAWFRLTPAGVEAAERQRAEGAE